MAAVFLKGNLEYQRGNYRKAIKVLNSIPPINLSFKETGESPAVLFYNNIGCIHHYMGKPNLACFYIFKALGENDAAMKSLPKPEPGEPYSGRPVHTVGSNKQYELMYNVGVCLLYGGQPTRAFDCLTEAIQVYHMNPRLWLRLAECCIMAHKQALVEAASWLTSRLDPELDVQVYSRLWLRLAECCIMAHKQFRPRVRCSGILQALVETGRVLHYGSQADPELDVQVYSRLWLRLAECCIIAHKQVRPRVRCSGILLALVEAGRVLHHGSQAG
uniref:CCR4-NOT transcription complex subunit 10 n=1 Tax=Timema douglasi TaxID=61478 RepID=A0A7R8VZV7_TIMDO|nr:unnamed protein product [Timema douglasi]